MASGLGFFSGPIVGELLYQVGQLHASSKFETIDSIRNSSCILQSVAQTLQASAYHRELSITNLLAVACLSIIILPPPICIR